MKVNAGDYYNYLGTIGTIALLLVYVLVNVGVIFYFKRNNKKKIVRHLIAPIIGILVMIFPIYSNLWPIPSWPMNIFPYIVLAWLILGFFMKRKSKA